LIRINELAMKALRGILPSIHASQSPYSRDVTDHEESFFMTDRVGVNYDTDEANIKGVAYNTTSGCSVLLNYGYGDTDEHIEQGVTSRWGDPKYYIRPEFTIQLMLKTGDYMGHALVPDYEWNVRFQVTFGVDARTLQPIVELFLHHGHHGKTNEILRLVYTDNEVIGSITEHIAPIFIKESGGFTKRIKDKTNFTSTTIDEEAMAKIQNLFVNMYDFLQQNNFIKHLALEDKQSGDNPDQDVQVIEATEVIQTKQ